MHAEPFQPGAQYFQRSATLRTWYEPADRARVPTWLGAAAAAVSERLLGRALGGLAEALIASSRPTAGVASAQAGAPLPRPTVVEMVRLGLKPAASFLIEGDEPPAALGDLPALVLSRVRYKRDALGNLVVADDPDPDGRRMVYVGRDEATLARLRDLDGLLALRPGTRPLPPAERRAHQEEFGRGMGYPACCARAFVHAVRPRGGDLHASIARLRLHLVPFDRRANHVVAHLYHFPFLIHEPCSPSCEPTLAAVDAALASLYPAWARAVVEDVLSHGAVVLPDDRVIFFRPRGEPANGELALSAFNVEPHPEALPHARAPERCVGRDAGGVRDADVEGLRVVERRLEVRVGDRLLSYEPPPSSMPGGPLVIVPRA